MRSKTNLFGLVATVVFCPSVSRVWLALDGWTGVDRGIPHKIQVWCRDIFHFRGFDWIVVGVLPLLGQSPCCDWILFASQLSTMPSKWQEKKNRQAEFAFEKALQTAAADTTVADVAKDAAMGKGEDELFERKLSKEEKKARAKAAREAKKKKKKGDEEDNENDAVPSKEVLQAAMTTDGPKTIEDDGVDHVKADALAAAGTICTYSTSRKGVDARARDINVSNFTLQHKGAVMLDETEIVLNHGNR